MATKKICICGFFVLNMLGMQAQEGDTTNKSPISAFLRQLVMPGKKTAANQLVYRPVKKNDSARLIPVCIASISKDGEVLNSAGFSVTCVEGNGYYLHFENTPLYPDNYVAEITFVNGTGPYISPFIGVNSQGSLCLYFHAYWPNNELYYIAKGGNSASVAFFVALYKLY